MKTCTIQFTALWGGSSEVVTLSQLPSREPRSPAVVLCFPKLSALTAHDKRSKADLIDILKSHGVVPTPGANKNELLQLLSQVERTPREEFLEAIHSFREEFTTGG